MEPVCIGALRLDHRVGLAPMAGLTDRAMRLLALEAGAGFAMTEVVNAAGIVRDSARTLHYLETGPGERPVAAHLYGSDPAVLAEAARRAEALQRFAFIDINAGCPVRKIVAKGAGAALMADPGRVEAIVRAVAGAVSLPVTVKTRLGLQPGERLLDAVARAVEAGGGAALFVHGRYAALKHAGPADWAPVAEIRARLSIPVFGNGGIDSAADAGRLLARWGLDGAIIGRAAVGNPWIFRDILRLERGEPAAGCSAAEWQAMWRRHLQELLALRVLERRRRRAARKTDEQAAVLAFRPHLYRYIRGLPGWNALRRELNTLDSIAAVEEAVERCVRPTDRLWPATPPGD